MFDHVVFGVSNYAEAKAFFVQALAPLGVEVASEGPLGLVQCAALFCTYPAAVAKAALARVTLARMSLALAVQMNGLGSML